MLTKGVFSPKSQLITSYIYLHSIASTVVQEPADDSESEKPVPTAVKCSSRGTA